MRLLHRSHILALIVVSITTIALLGAYARRHTLSPEAGFKGGIPMRSNKPLAVFSENGVKVEINLVQDSSGQRWLVGTFTPLLEHFHLYSKDLPRGGLLGQGRPTLLEIIAPEEMKSAGALIADQPTISHFSRVLNEGLPVYPEGPVGLRLPITLSPGHTPTLAELSLTYMACSNEICLTPVIDRHISVLIP